MAATGFPKEVVEGIKDSIDCNLYFFDNKVELSAMYVIVAVSAAALIGIYILINAVFGKKK